MVTNDITVMALPLERGPDASGLLPVPDPFAKPTASGQVLSGSRFGYASRGC